MREDIATANTLIDKGEYGEAEGVLVASGIIKTRSVDAILTGIVSRIEKLMEPLPRELPFVRRGRLYYIELERQCFEYLDKKPDTRVMELSRAIDCSKSFASNVRKRFEAQRNKA